MSKSYRNSTENLIITESHAREQRSYKRARKESLERLKAQHEHEQDMDEQNLRQYLKEKGELTGD